MMYGEYYEDPEEENRAIRARAYSINECALGDARARIEKLEAGLHAIWQLAYENSIKDVASKRTNYEIYVVVRDLLAPPATKEPR